MSAAKSPSVRHLSSSPAHECVGSRCICDDTDKASREELAEVVRLEEHALEQQDAPPGAPRPTGTACLRAQTDTSSRYPAIGRYQRHAGTSAMKANCTCIQTPASQAMSSPARQTSQHVPSKRTRRAEDDDLRNALTSRTRRAAPRRARPTTLDEHDLRHRRSAATSRTGCCGPPLGEQAIEQVEEHHDQHEGQEIMPPMRTCAIACTAWPCVRRQLDRLAEVSRSSTLRPGSARRSSGRTRTRRRAADMTMPPQADDDQDDSAPTPAARSTASGVPRTRAGPASAW